METAMVAGIGGLMFAMALPALQLAREESRGFVCANNLKVIGMGVQGYFNADKAFPAGSVTRYWVRYYGFNYVRSILKHVGEEKLSDVVERGFYDEEGGNIALNWYLRSRLSGKSLSWLTCPSSPLPAMVEFSAQPYDYYLPNTPNPAVYQSLDYSACTGSWQSSHRTELLSDPMQRKGFSGLMPSYFWESGDRYSSRSNTIGGSKQGKYGVRLRDVSDGLAKTIAIAETSGQLFGSNGQVNEGRTVRTGFLQGPCCNDWQSTTHGGTTTISLPVGTTSTELVNAVGGARPITSGHGTCGYVLFADGAVKLLTEETAINVLFALADRDDGAVLGDDVLP
jgi:hypothetical protein